MVERIPEDVFFRSLVKAIMSAFDKQFILYCVRNSDKERSLRLARKIMKVINDFIKEEDCTVCEAYCALMSCAFTILQVLFLNEEERDEK